jgi:predicted O-linked N-acetylglucosamine transferase (SPINDLY family)
MITLPELLKHAFDLIQAGKLDEARIPLDQALAEAPENLDANAMMGFVAARQKRWAEAHRCYAKASDLMPTDYNLAASAGECAFFSTRLDQAIPFLRRAVAIDPGELRAVYVLGKALAFTDTPVEGIGHLRRVLATGYRPAEVKVWLAQALRNSGYAEEAVSHLRDAARLSPTNAEVRTQLATSMNYAVGVTAAEVAQAHAEYGRVLSESIRSTPRPQPRVHRGPRPGKLRVGLLSPDLKRHSVSFFLLPIVENLNQDRFEVCCYHAWADEDSFSERYKAAAKLWRNIHGLDGVQISEQIAADQVHVLIELAGHTSNTRMPVLALRPAPVQMTYLGYPNTTGLRECDYRVTDSLTDPPVHAALHTETLLYVEPCSHTFEPLGGWASLPAPQPPPCIANGFTTFGCFGAIQKFSDELIAMLARTVLGVPDSRLLVKLKFLASEEARADLRARFAREGLKGDHRLLLEGPVPRGEDMLAEYLRADIALDTFPYHGTTVTCECLSVGVPVITRAGNRTASRVGLSLLSAVGLGDLAADSEPGFASVALRLASDVERLKTLRRELRSKVRATLGDHAAFCRAFEAAVDHAWTQAALSPLPPR